MKATLFLTLMSLTALGVSEFDRRDKKQMLAGDRIQINKTSEWISSELSASDQNHKSSIVEQKREILIGQIEALLRKAPSKSRLELKLRLGKLYVELYYIHLARAQDEKGRLTASRTLERARMLYSGLLQEYQTDPRRDQMLYFFALTSMDKGLHTESMRIFQEIIDRYPKSVFRYDAMVQLGDYYFDKGEYAKAEVYYVMLVNSQYKPLTPYSVYKRAWCAYNTRRPAFALQNFKWVVVNEEKFSAKHRVRNEALNDMTLPYADLKLVDDAHQFYFQQGDAIYRKAMETISFLLYERGSYDESIGIWQKLSVMDPLHFKNSEYDLKIVSAYRIKRDRKNSIAHMNSSIPTYLGDTSWTNHNSKNRKAFEEQRMAWEDVLRNFAYEFHNEYDKTSNLEVLEPAKNLYLDYVKYFPKTAHSQKIHVNLARIYVVLKQPLQAAEQYYAAAQYTEDKALAETSLHDATKTLLAYLVSERPKQKLLNPDSDDFVEEIPYTEVENQSITVSEEFLKRYPQHKEALAIRYEIGYIKYLHADFDAAFAAFDGLTKVAPTSSQATASSYHMLDMLGRQKAYPKMVVLCHQFLKGGSQDATFRRNIGSILRMSELKQIELLEKDGKYELAAKEYLRYSDQYGKDDASLHQKALYNAGVNYGLAGMYSDALMTNERYYREFSKTAQASEVMLKIARTYELFGENQKAANWYSGFHKSNPKHPQSSTALRLAGLHFWAAGQNPMAERLLKQSIEESPKTAELVKVDLLDLYESSPNRSNKLGQYYQAQLQQPQLTRANELYYQVKLAEVTAERRGNIPRKMMEEAVQFAKQYAKAVRKTSAGTNAYGKVMFWDLLQKEKTFRNIRLAGAQAQMEANFKKKLNMIKDLEKDYLTLSKSGSPHWGLGSIYKTARLYYDLGLEIQSAPVPKALTAAQGEEYRNQVRDTFVRPFHEKALTLSKQCLDQANALGLYSGWISRCYEVASKVDGSSYPVVRTFYLPAGFTGALEPPKGARTPAGGSTSLPEMYFSTGLYTAPDDMVRRNPLNSLLNEDEVREIASTSSNPYAVGYQTQAQERGRRLQAALDSLYPAKPGAPVTYAFLTSMRLKAPSKALAFLKEAIRKDPENEALQHLLGLTYLEMNSIPAAKVTWSLQSARGLKSPQISNSIGLALLAEGREEDAIASFEHAAADANHCDEAELNLAFLALKYRNGSLAAKYFGEIVMRGTDKYEVATEVGLSVAKVHGREMEAAREKIANFTARYAKDPYARLTTGYFMLDVENNNEGAMQTITDYIQQNPGADALLPFQKALQEARARATEQEIHDSVDPNPRVSSAQ